MQEAWYVSGSLASLKSLKRQIIIINTNKWDIAVQCQARGDIELTADKLWLGFGECCWNTISDPFLFDFWIRTVRDWSGPDQTKTWQCFAKILFLYFWLWVILPLLCSDDIISSITHASRSSVNPILDGVGHRHHTFQLFGTLLL